jgi:hypothetical protein
MASVVACALVSLCGIALGQQAEEVGAALRPSPAPIYVIEEVKVRAAPQAGALQGTMSVRVRGLVGERTWVPLFRGNVGVLSAEVSGGGWFGPNPTLIRQQDAVGLLLPGKGRYQATLEFATPVTTEQQASLAPLPTVAALSGVYEISLEGTNVDVWLAPEVPFQKTVEGRRTVVTVYGGTGEPLMLRWTPGPEVREVETMAFAEQSMLLDVSRGLLRVDATILYSVLQGRMPTAAVELPAGYSLLKVEGDNLRGWDIEKGAGGPDRLVATLLDAARERFTVKLALERTLEAVPVEVDAPQVIALGVNREKGTVAVAVEKGLQAEVVEREGIGQVDLSEMPSQLSQLGTRFSLGLKYLARPVRVRLRVSPIEPKVYGEVACLTVASLERCRQNWDVRYEIRDAGVFQLRLRLAPGMKLMGLQGQNINNQSLDPATNVLTVDLRAKAEGSYQLSVQTASAVPSPETTSVPALELLGVERQWGTIAVSADSGIAVETRKLSGISQTDVAELKSMAPLQGLVAAQKAAEPVLAFRYLSFPYQLELTVSHIQPEMKCEPMHSVELTRKSLRYYSVFNYRIKKAGVFQLRMHLPAALRPNLTVKGPKVEDYSYDAAGEVLTIQLTDKALGDLQVEVQTETLLGKELPRPGQSAVFAIPTVYTLDCEQERGHITIGTDESIRLKRAGEGGALHDVDVQEVPPALLQRARNAKLAFRVIESPWNLDLEVTSITPKITAQTFNYVRFGEDYLIGASTVELTIQYAGVNEFFVRLPEGVTNPNIRGDNIKVQEKVQPRPESSARGSAIEMVLPSPRPTEAPTKPGELWRIELQSEVKGTYQLIFEYTMDLDPKEKQRTFAGPVIMGETKGVERETGYVAVTGDPSLELAPLAEDLQNLTPVDEEEIPVKFRELPPSMAAQIGRQTVPILFAFRYLAHPYKLALSSVRHEEADVVTAVVESCKLDTTLTREGNRITSMVASVRSRYQPFLQIALPADAKLWHALVNGRRVRPLTDRLTQGEVTKIPISQVQGVSGPVKVELQWEEFGREMGRFETVRLEVPSLAGVRILRLAWILQLPRDYRVIASGGTLERLSSLAYLEQSLQRLQPTEQPAAVPAAGAPEEAAQQNIQWASNQAVLSGRAAGKETGRPAAVFPGAKPVLPQQFCFQGLILNPDVPALATAVCVADAAMIPLAAVAVLIVFGLCALFWHKSGLKPGLCFAVLVAVALLVAGVRMVAEGNYADLLLAVIITVLATAVLFGILSIWKASARRKAARQAPERPADAPSHGGE